MFKLQIGSLFAYIYFVLYGSLAESENTVQSVCLLQDPSNQCGQFCLTALKPMLDHIALHQQEWSTCSAEKLNETQSKLDRIEGFISKLELILDRLESGQKKLENQHAVIFDELSSILKKIGLLRFEPVGSRYFYVENSMKQNWTSAAHTCRDMGGYLASFRNEKEFDAIQSKLRNDRWYWLGITDKIQEGQYVSVDSDSPASFLKWGSGDPDDWNHSQNCVVLGNRKMWDSRCNDPNYFICQSYD